MEKNKLERALTRRRGGRSLQQTAPRRVSWTSLPVPRVVGQRGCRECYRESFDDGTPARSDAASGAEWPRRIGPFRNLATRSSAERSPLADELGTAGVEGCKRAARPSNLCLRRLEGGPLEQVRGGGATQHRAPGRRRAQRITKTEWEWEWRRE